MANIGTMYIIGNNKEQKKEIIKLKNLLYKNRIEKEDNNEFSLLIDTRNKDNCKFINNIENFKKEIQKENKKSDLKSKFDTTYVWVDYKEEGNKSIILISAKHFIPIFILDLIGDSINLENCKYNGYIEFDYSESGIFLKGNKINIESTFDPLGHYYLIQDYNIIKKYQEKYGSLNINIPFSNKKVIKKISKMSIGGFFGNEELIKQLPRKLKKLVKNYDPFILKVNIINDILSKNFSKKDLQISNKNFSNYKFNTLYKKTKKELNKIRDKNNKKDREKIKNNKNNNKSKIYNLPF